jgi:acyl-CoA reductase-like NAD-dependent aldehyde dehydrogenase
VELGAVTFAPQVEIIERHIRDAVDKGADVAVGGKLGGGPGRFFEPTVLTGVDHSMEIMTEETFGPTLPIMKVRDADEALRLANDTRYGLNSSVFTNDVEKGERIARDLTAGNACVNDAVINYAATEMPFGGSGESGVGVRHGAAGIQKYCQVQSIAITRPGLASKRELYHFPYSTTRSRIVEMVPVLMNGRVPRKYRKR